MNVERIVRDITEGGICNVTSQTLSLAIGSVLIGLSIGDLDLPARVLKAVDGPDYFAPSLQYDEDYDFIKFQAINGESFYLKPIGCEYFLYYTEAGDRLIGFSRGNL